MTAQPEHEPGEDDRREDYVGPAEVLGEDGQPAIAVEVHLRGHFEPIDGRFHWFGRIAAHDALAERHRAGSAVVLRTPYGSAAGKIADLDPWGRFRITGVGTPPF